jgi:hypothetical protein
MIGLPNGLTFFDFGFILAFGIEDLFFFFCSSRPMIAVSECGELSLYETTKNLSFWLDHVLLLTVPFHHVID